MEGLHVVGDILTKISVNFVINYMLHNCLRVCFYVFILCVVYNYVYIYGYFLYMLHVYVYYYLSMNLCIYIMYLSVYILYIKLRKSSVCICFNCMQFEKIMWHSSVGCLVCYSMVSENEIIFWSSMARHGWSGMLQHGIRASIFNTEPGWAEQVELRNFFIED
jgi:hypothetical protein